MTEPPPLWSGFRIAAAFIRRHPPLLWLLLGIPALAIVVVPSLSYEGFCFEQKRFLSDNEYVDIAITRMINQDYYQNLDTSRPSAIGFQPVQVIKYKDIAEFRRLNPDCCKFVPHNPGSERRPVTFGDQLFGQAAKSVLLTYVIKYLDDAGAEKAFDAIAQLTIGNCGRIMNKGR